jgi:hypothetical protein
MRHTQRLRECLLEVTNLPSVLSDRIKRVPEQDSTVLKNIVDFSLFFSTN